jgi:hypothetical protein
MKKVWNGIKKEWEETKEMSSIIYSRIQGKTVCEKTNKKAITQIFDIFKALFLGIILLLPGGCFIMAAFVKMFGVMGIQLLPTAFNEGETDE